MLLWSPSSFCHTNPIWGVLGVHLDHTINTTWESSYLSHKERRAWAVNVKTGLLRRCAMPGHWRRTVRDLHAGFGAWILRQTPSPLWEREKHTRTCWILSTPQAELSDKTEWVNVALVRRSHGLLTPRIWGGRCRATETGLPHPVLDAEDWKLRGCVWISSTFYAVTLLPYQTWPSEFLRVSPIRLSTVLPLGIIQF